MLGHHKLGLDSSSRLGSSFAAHAPLDSLGALSSIHNNINKKLFVCGTINDTFIIFKELSASFSHKTYFHYAIITKEITGHESALHGVK